MSKKHRRKNLHRQKYDVLNSKLTPGVSKHAAKLDGSYLDFIYSYCTYNTYSRHGEYFLIYMKMEHPQCKQLDNCKPFVYEYLDKLVKDGYYSAHTIHLKAKALGKLFDIRPGDPEYFRPPTRHRKDIKRSRPGNSDHKNFSEENNAELIMFCNGTGLRRHELGLTYPEYLYSREEIISEFARLSTIPDANLTKEDRKKLSAFEKISFFTNDEEFFVYVPCGKGGKPRISPIIGNHVGEIVGIYRNTPAGTKVWPHIHSGANIHAFRAQYAATLYLSYARSIEDIPYDKVNAGSGYMYQSDVYVARNDMHGIKLDRKAMLVSSKALGHERIHVIASNYLWCL